MEEESKYLLQSLYDAWKQGATVYKDDQLIHGISDLGVLMEDSGYMLDVEGDDWGDIVRINFVRVRTVQE